MDLQQSRGNEAMCDFLKVLKERNIFISTKVQSWEEFALQHINVNQKPWSWDILDIGFDKRLPTSMRIPLMKSGGPKSDSFTLAFIQKSTLHHEKWSDCVSEDDTAVWRQRNIRSRCCIFDYFCREEAHTERKESDLRQNHVGHHRKDKQGRRKVSSQQNNETTFLFLYGKLNKCFHFVEVVKQSHKQTR